MEKPSRKLKKTYLILGVTGAVYASFRYLLPLAIPFLIAYIFALALRPSAMWLEKKCRFSLKKKEIHVPLAAIGGIEILVLLAVLGGLIYIGARKLCIEANLFLDNLPIAINHIDQCLTGWCSLAEDLFHLPRMFLVKMLRDMLRGGMAAMKETAMPFFMANSMTLIKCFVKTAVMGVILFIGTVLSLHEMDDIRRRRDRSIFRHEFSLLGNRLAIVGSAWIKAQGSIMFTTMCLCAAGLFLMGNQYSLLLGIGLGLFDALPIFGTGTVLVPWAIVRMAGGDWLYGMGLLLIYVISYFLREVMEAKLMGDKVGLTPLETLISMYVGLELFGIPGFLLGPIGLLIIEDLVEMYGDSCKKGA